MLKAFKEFALRGNVVDMAVGIVVGGAFGTIVSSLVADVLMPPVGALLGGVDFADLFWVVRQGTPAGPYATVAAAQEAGAVTIQYGLFLNSVISFLIVASALFFVVRAMNALKKSEPVAAPAVKDCPRCAMSVPLQASRCPHCTSEIG
jgi:large conductance mechanosensitive channel